MFQRSLAALLILGLWSFTLRGQTPAQEASNGFALFLKNKDISQLEKAKKAIDRIYKTRKDSASYRNNILRSLIYSSLAVADTKRSLDYSRDPALDALASLKKLESLKSKSNDDYQQEIAFSRQKLALYFTEKANAEVQRKKYADALKSYQKVDSLSPGDWKIVHNLAVLHGKMGNVTKAAVYYKVLTEDGKRSSPEYFIGYAALFERRNDFPNYLEILKKGKARFPDNRDLLFRIINLYTNNDQLDAVTALIDEAEGMDKKNAALQLLAGLSYQKLGKIDLAENYLKHAVELDGSNYEANYSLGLIYLSLYLKDTNDEKLAQARKYIARALEIDPGNPNALRSAEIIYDRSGELAELDRVRTKLKTTNK